MTKGGGGDGRGSGVEVGEGMLFNGKTVLQDENILKICCTAMGIHFTLLNCILHCWDSVNPEKEDTD